MTKGGGVRLALVGAGGPECGRIAGVLSGMGALVAVCDPDERRAASCGQEYSVSHYGDVGVMIRSETFDGAVVATSAAARAAAASELLGAGKHVCVQWPPACDAAGVGALLELADRKRAVLSCLHATRSGMAAEAMRDAAASSSSSSDAYGRLMSFDMRVRGSPASTYADRNDCDYGDERGSGGPGDDNADSGSADSDNAGDDSARAVRAMQADFIYAANLMFDAAPQVVFAVSGGLKDGRPEDHLTTVLGYGGGSVATISINPETSNSSESAEAVLEGAVIKADLSEGLVRTEPAEAGPGPGRAAGNRSLPPGSLSLDLRLRSWLEDFADAISRGGEQERRTRAARGVVHAQAAIKAAKASLLSARRGIPIYLDLR